MFQVKVVYAHVFNQQNITLCVPTFYIMSIQVCLNNLGSSNLDFLTIVQDQADPASLDYLLKPLKVLLVSNYYYFYSNQSFSVGLRSGQTQAGAGL